MVEAVVDGMIEGVIKIKIEAEAKTNMKMTMSQIQIIINVPEKSAASSVTMKII